MSEEKTVLAVEVIIDNSGSMGPSKGGVVEGVNRFIEELATAIIPARLGVTLYDDRLRKSLIDGVSVADGPRLRERDYHPDHPVEDIARCVIQALEVRLAPVSAHRKVLVVMTDGQNSSPDMAKAKALVARRRKEGWLILWLGIYPAGYGHGEYAKEALLRYAKGLGIPEDVTFALPHTLFKTAMPLAAKATLRFMAGGEGKFTPEERKLITADED